MNEVDAINFKNLNILLTCDDGVDSTLTYLLYDELIHNNKVIMLLPDKNVSSTSAAITVNSPIRLCSVASQERQYFVSNGYLADCVAIGCNNLVSGNIDTVITGINNGLNIGEDILYSANVMAAREAVVLGKIAIAVSVEGLKNISPKNVVNIVMQIFNKIFHLLEKGYIYNINIPDCNMPETIEVVFTELSKEHNITSFSIESEEKNCYMIRPVAIFSKDSELNKRSDAYVVKTKRISITKLKINELMSHIEISNKKLEKLIL